MSVRVCWWSRAAASPGRWASYAVVLGRLIVPSSQRKAVKMLDGNRFPQGSSVMETEALWTNSHVPLRNMSLVYFLLLFIVVFLIILIAQLFYQSYPKVEEDLLSWLFKEKKKSYHMHFETLKPHSPKPSTQMTSKTVGWKKICWIWEGF